MKLKTVLICLIFGSCQATAQDTINLEEVIAWTLHKNFDILLSRNDSAAAAVDDNLSYAAFLPALNGTVNKLWNSNNQVQTFADGSKRERKGVKANNIAAGVDLDWTLFDGLKMFATRERVKTLHAIGSLAVKQQIIESVADVINNYYSIVRQKQQLRAIEEQISINEERVKLANRKFSVGLGARPELLQAQVDLNAQKAAKLQQNTVIAQLKEQLNQLTGMKLPSRFEVTEDIPIDFDLSIGNLASDIDRTNPDLQIALKNITVAELMLKERKAERFPVLSWGTSYNFTRQVNSAVVNPAFALTSRNSGFNYGFSLNIPILNNLSVKRNIDLARFGIQRQQLAYENQLSLVNLGLVNAFKDYEYQKQALQLEEENIKLAKENVNIALERFRLGVSTNLQLREAQISLEEANNRLIAARYNTKLAETELMRLKGDLVK